MWSLRPMLLVPFAAFAGMAGLFALGPRDDGPGVGYLDRPLPAFDPAPMPGTETGFSSADLTGQVVLLNVFAAWCASCREEHPFLVKLAETGTVPIYGLNWKDAPGAGKVFLDKLGNPYAATADDSAGAIGDLLQVTGVPETYLVDAEGRVRYRHLGPMTEQLWAETLNPLIARLEESR